MERFFLLPVGLNLHKKEDGNLDFEYTLNFLKNRDSQRVVQPRS
jgi:hypothetical protein